MSLALLRRLVRDGTLRAIDYQLARQFAAYAEHAPDQIALATALVSIALGRGDVCVDLAPAPARTRPVHLPAALSEAFDADRMCDALRSERRVCALAPAAGASPLVLDGSRLYFQRYFAGEARVAARLRELAGQVFPLGPAATRLLDALFGVATAAERGQKLAAASALTRGLGVVSGGPGTGKTTTVARLLLVLAGARAPQRLRIALAAPTGKAAARVSQAVAREFARLGGVSPEAEALAAQLPREAQTLHRLLEARSGGDFRRDAGNPLAVDLVVLDECSMIDQRLLDALLGALAKNTRLLLLGDRDQLAAVEAGNVFAALCADAGARGDARARELSALVGFDVPAQGTASTVAEATALLRHSYRFDGSSGIARLAAAVNAGRADDVNALFTNPDPALHCVRYEGGLEAAHLETAVACYRDLLVAVQEGQEPHAIGRLMERFRILCARRDGSFGVTGINRALELILAAQGLIDGTVDCYAGRPIIVTRNDHGLRLYNGDVGIIARDRGGALRALFVQPGGEPRWLPTTRLPEHETAFAMTVHKSQGSEFDEVLIVLPPAREREETGDGRELLYTAITRARERVNMLMPAGALAPHWLRSDARDCGLREKLYTSAAGAGASADAP